MSRQLSGLTTKDVAPAAKALVHRLHIFSASGDDKRNVPEVFVGAHQTDKFKSIHHRHVEIDERQVEMRALQQVKRFGAIGGRHDFDAVRRQIGGGEFTQDWIVIDDYQTRGFEMNKVAGGHGNTVKQNGRPVYHLQVKG
jgi:hypothetical protein